MRCLSLRARCLAVVATLIASSAWAEEGWILAEIRTTPAEGSSSKTLSQYGAKDWHKKRDVRVERPSRANEGRARILVSFDYRRRSSGARIAHHVGRVTVEPLPRQLRPGETLTLRAHGEYVSEGRFAGHDDYYTGILFTFDGGGGKQRINPSRDNEGPDRVELTQSRRSATLERKFSVPRPYVNPMSGAKNATLHISAKADFDVLMEPRITWVYRLGEIEAEPEPPELVEIRALDGNPGLYVETDRLEKGGIKPSALIQRGIDRKGTTADGVSALVLRAELTNDSPVRFSMEPAGHGSLEPLFSGRTLELGERYYAFARYVPPESLSEKGAPPAKSTLSQPLLRSGGPLGPEAEELEFRVGGASGSRRSPPLGSLKLHLARPPVVLVHGLFSNPVQAWMGRLATDSSGIGLPVMLERAGFVPFLVNYARTNGGSVEGESWLTGERKSSEFAANRRVVWESPDDEYAAEKESAWLREEEPGWLGVSKVPILSEWQKPKELRIGGIRAALDHYRDELALAATQADVVGHSMGGLLARVHASKVYNPDYERAENFFEGDINRILTLNTPHFGAELTELHDILTLGKVQEEEVVPWVRRWVSSWVVRGLLGGSETGAIRDLRPHSKALEQIGSTKVPAFAIATWAEHGQLGKSRFDPGSVFLMAYSGIGMMFFHNDALLQAAVMRRANEWRDAGEWQRRTAFGGRTSGTGSSGSYGVVDLHTEQGARRYWRTVMAGIDESTYHWARYREAAFRDELGERASRVRVVPPDFHDSEQLSRQGTQVLEDIGTVASQATLGGSVLRVRRDDLVPDIPHEAVDAIRTLIFKGDPENDAAVRAVSQRGGLPKEATETFSGIVHSFAPWHPKVQREVVRLLRWQRDRFHEPGFPAAAQPMPHWLPTAETSEARVTGELAVAWSGMVPSHAREYLRVADREHVVVLGRPVNQDSTQLIIDGAATKGMAIKGKSSTWGPHRGLIAYEARFSKVWRTKSGAARDADIAKYDEVNRLVVDEKVYPADPEAPELEGRPFAVKRALIVQAGGAEFEVLVDDDETDSEEAVFLYDGKTLFDWRTGEEERGGRRVPVFDRERAPAKEITGAVADRVIAAKKPLYVLADGLSELEPRPYLTADYDLLAIAFHRPDKFHGVPDHVKEAEYHDIRGFISKPQLDLVKKLNKAVEQFACYEAGNLTHHGPEVQYGGSEYVDYPILVFDPGTKEPGDAEFFLIRQGPVGFRDIHLKRYVAEKVRDDFNLWPNPDSPGWSWEYHRDFSRERGYDERDAPSLLAYVDEQPRPKNFDERGNRTGPPLELDPCGSGRPVAVGTGLAPSGTPPPRPTEKKVAATAPVAPPVVVPPAPSVEPARAGTKPPPEISIDRRAKRGSGPSAASEAQASGADRYAALDERELKRASKRDPRAALELGDRYANGTGGVKQSPKHAIAFYERAARRDAEAMMRLARLYDAGQGVRASPKHALKWYRAAALTGVVEGQRSLAEFYRKGRPGIRSNPSEAYAWYRLAAEQGDPQAKTAVQELEKELDERARTRGVKRADAFRRKIRPLR